MTRIHNIAAALTLAALTLLAAGCVTATMHREKGQTAQARGEYAAAIDHYRACLDKEPLDHRARLYLGECLLNEGQYREAQFELEKVVAARRHDTTLANRALDRLAEALYKQDRPIDLYDLLETTTAEDPSVRSYLRQADYMIKLGDHDLAAVAFQKAANFAQPDDPEPYLAAARFFESINDNVHAARNLRYAAYVDPDHPDIDPAFRRLGIVPGPTLPLKPPALDN
ncbi:tetratricopeptide repeat protein [Mucisphaera calidilacus]|uniref:Cellulose synthase subunit BcsC n=1 Tax=Mucisphaera calidilacus TaxID=2527982 RepID=A0A518BTZ1_9BACT|nr:tetratricopeptide repeat protein [Mucisphaera calidilacus]QDU70425.1 cellulose synthase subunit BcsC [Mucisphaera calidilacus]